MSQTVAKINELHRACKRVYIFLHNDEHDHYVTCECILVDGKEYGNDVNKVELKVKGDNIDEAVSLAHAKVIKMIDRAPEFDANKTIEHHPNDEWEA